MYICNERIFSCLAFCAYAIEKYKFNMKNAELSLVWNFFTVRTCVVLKLVHAKKHNFEALNLLISWRLVLNLFILNVASIH